MHSVRRVCRSWFGTVVLLLCPAAGIHAAVLTYIDNFNASGAASTSLSFAQFDPSLGTLQSATLEDSFTLNTTASATGVSIPNPFPPPAFTCTPGSSSSTASFTGISGVFESVTANAFDPTCIGAIMPASGSFDVNSVVTGAGLSSYLGTGQVSIGISFNPGQTGSVTETATVTYTYQATPEPAPPVLLMGPVLVWAMAQLVHTRYRAG